MKGDTMRWILLIVTVLVLSVGTSFAAEPCHDDHVDLVVPTPRPTYTPTPAPPPKPCLSQSGVFTGNSALYAFSDLNPRSRAVLRITLTNPDSATWTYQFKSNWRPASANVSVTVDQDGRWKVNASGRTGKLSRFDSRPGASNYFEFIIPQSSYSWYGGGWRYGQFAFHVNEESVPVEVRESVLRANRDKSRDVYVRASAGTRYTRWTQWGYSRQPCRIP